MTQTKEDGEFRTAESLSTADELEQILRDNRAKSKERKKSGKSQENDFLVKRRPIYESETSHQPLRRQLKREHVRQTDRNKHQEQLLLAASMRHQRKYEAEEDFHLGTIHEALSPSEARKRRKQSSIKIQRQKRKSTKI